jgi:REP element-mobilizing transposase RayT
VQHIVVRLADALPASTVAALDRLLPARRHEEIVRALRDGHGGRALADPRAAEIVERALLHFDGARYRLLAWCVMPTHVHALIAQIEGYPLSAVAHSWKSFTANAANRALGRSGRFWAPEYYDRFMRDERQLEATRAYVENNPVAAGLCAKPEDWRFSSARPDARTSAEHETPRAGGPRYGGGSRPGTPGLRPGTE